MKKLVFISNIPSPYIVKFCKPLNAYYNAEFWFYNEVTTRRPEFWKIPLGEKCKILPDTKLVKWQREFSLKMWNWLNKFKPDFVLLGGFSKPGNYLAYIWARIKGKKVIVFTEKSRDKSGNLRKYSLTWHVLRYLYKNVDKVMVATPDAVAQFRDEFGFGKKVALSQYPVDIDSYYDHKIRVKKGKYNLIFANRLISIYNPLGAIRIFNEIKQRNAQLDLHLYLNGFGKLRSECEQLIEQINLRDNISFLDDILEWDDLGKIYNKCDIYFFPAKYSNGNMSMVESMASGMGIIISDQVGGSGHKIENGVNGFRIPLKDELFIDAIEKYLQNPELYRTHARLNRNIVKERKSDETAKLYFDILESI